MANERQWDAVPPISLIADGTTEGVLKVVDTAGFFFGMQATLSNNTPSQLTVYIKRVVDKNTLWVGHTKGGMDHNVDVSTFTVSSGATIFAAMQNKSTVPNEARLLATYETDPIDAWRVRPVDPYGNGYTPTNPFPVVPTSVLFNSLTLGSLGMPVFVQECLSGMTYNQVISTTSGNVETLNILNNGVSVDSIIITYTPGGWSFVCAGPITGFYLLLETGYKFLLEDSSGDILLE